MSYSYQEGRAGEEGGAVAALCELFGISRTILELCLWAAEDQMSLFPRIGGVDGINRAVQLWS